MAKIDYTNGRVSALGQIRACLPMFEEEVKPLIAERLYAIQAEGIEAREKSDRIYLAVTVGDISTIPLMWWIRWGQFWTVVSCEKLSDTSFILTLYRE